MMMNPRYFVGKEPNGNLLARGRDYSDPIDTMVKAIPSDCKHSSTDIIEALCKKGYRVVLVEASMLRIMEQIAQRRDQAARAVGGEVR